MPCNGLLYIPSHSCACYIQAKLNGFNALAPKRPSRVAKPQSRDDDQLERGPAYPQITNPKSRIQKIQNREDWPTYRHDAARSGRTASVVPASLSRSWQTDLGGQLSSPVIANGKVFLASIDEHTVRALHADDGTPIWSYTTGGRVDSPPTVHKGLVLFGSADGWVYCLRGSDGQLAWRRRAAPEQRRVVAYGQVESAWPVHGNVLVRRGAAYFVAGRSAYLDGGMHLWKVDPATGKQLARVRIDDRDPETGAEPQDTIQAQTMSGSLADVLSADGTSIFMRHKRFDQELKEQEPDVPHLFSSVGLLDGSWWHRTYWMIGTNMMSDYGGWPRVGNRVPAGRILAFDDSAIFGFGRRRYAHHGAHTGLDATTIFHYRPGNTRWTGYHLFAMNRTGPFVEKPEPKPKAAKKKRRGRPAPPPKKYLWAREVPLLVRAMVLTNKILLLAGPPTAADSADPLAAIKGRNGGLLWAVSAADGKKLAEYKLDAPPIFDAMAAANKRVYMATTDGKVLCYAGK